MFHGGMGSSWRVEQSMCPIGPILGSAGPEEEGNQTGTMRRRE